MTNGYGQLLSLEFKTGSLPKKHASAQKEVVCTDLRMAG